MLEVRHLRKRYSGIPAVDDVSFVARAGEVTGYLGANGSGKSTTMKMATGLIEPTSGEILFEGQPIKTDPMAYRQRLGYVPEEPHLYTHLSGMEYLVMVAELRDIRYSRGPRCCHVVLFKGNAAEDTFECGVDAQSRSDTAG